MKIANVADIHARGKDLETCRSQLAAMVAECVKREIDLVTIAGDVFDRATIGDNHASTGAIAEVPIRAVAELTKHGIEVLMIPGNHDVSGAGSAHALHVFDGMTQVKIPTARYGWLSYSGLAIAYLPWSWSGSANALLDTLGFSEDLPSMLLAHVRVTGAKMSGSFTCDDAKPGTWQVSRGFLESLPFDRFALGDFHARQDLTGGRGGYVGALRQLTFGEEGNPTGFECWDTETGETEWVELDAAPRYHTTVVDFNASDTPLALPKLRGSNQRVQIIGGQIDHAVVRGLESEGVLVEHIIEPKERIQRADVPEGIINDDHALIRLWAGTLNPPIEAEELVALLRTHDEVFADKPASQPAAKVESDV